jgi:hypothetical protein
MNTQPLAIKFRDRVSWGGGREGDFRTPFPPEPKYYAGCFKKELHNGIPNAAVWRVLRKRLHLKACKLSIVQHFEDFALNGRKRYSGCGPSFLLSLHLTGETEEKYANLSHYT